MRSPFYAFVFLLLLTPGAIAADISCSSVDGEPNHCSLPDADRLNVKIKQRLDGLCKFGQSWGVDSDGVWVDMGCRAIFRYSASPIQRAGWKRFLPRWVR